MPKENLFTKCGKINRIKKWKQVFINNYETKPQLHNFRFFEIDTSQNSNDEYEQFKKLDTYDIILC